MDTAISLDEAVALDDADPLSAYRSEFVFPQGADGAPVAYFAGNSLGLMPRRARAAVEAVMTQWSDLAVAGHFTGDDAWYGCEERFEALQAPLVGAQAGEVALMGSLTENLHVLMASFHRPRGDRTAILIEPHAFPSDRYAVASQVELAGGDPDVDVITIAAADPDRVTVDDLAAVLDAEGHRIATALIGGVNYYTGQFLELGPMCALLRANDITVGLDLAHAVGNVPLALHDWNVDFAAWCTYKYLNSGPGSTAGIFVHDRHGADTTIVRQAGWWGNDPSTRFAMHDQDRFVARPGAAGWKMSNPSILALAPVGASLALFDEIGAPALRERSLRLTAFLQRGLTELTEAVDGCAIVTPAEPDRRGCQLSLRVPGSATDLEAALADRGVIVDARDPDVIRLAPTPLYNSFADIAAAVAALGELLGT